MKSKGECEIYVCKLTRLYVIGVNGCCRLRGEYKTFAGATRGAQRKGYTVVTTADPMPAFLEADGRTKIVTNMQSGKLVRIGENTPACCDPSTETYWSM